MDDDAKTAIYSPPRPGLPHLLVTVAHGEITAMMPVASRDEARRILMSKASERPAVHLVAPNEMA